MSKINIININVRTLVCADSKEFTRLFAALKLTTGSEAIYVHLYVSLEDMDVFFFNDRVKVKRCEK